MKLRTIFRHPIRALDDWWYEQAPAHRRDRESMYIAVMIPVWLYSATILAIGPPLNPSSQLSEPVQYMLASAMFLGLGASLIGTLLGSKFLKPDYDIRRAYMVGYSVAPIGAAGLIAHGWAVVLNAPDPISFLGAFVGPAIGIGLLLKALGFWLEVRRLDRTLAVIVGDIETTRGVDDDDTTDS